jgi:hypothetical protein
MRGCFYTVLIRHYKNIYGGVMKFKCKISGTIAEFTQPVDIISMLEHPQYEVVEEVEIKEVKESPKKKTTKESE